MSSPTLARRSKASFSKMSKSKSMWNLSDPGRKNSFVDKAKLTQLVKTAQLEQLSKLQNKHLQECELLDDIRNFGKQRSQLEREYALALQKLVLQYQRKGFPNKPSAPEGNHATIVSVWQTILESTDKAAQARIKSSDAYKNGIYEAAKNFRSQKEANLKKCQDLLTTLQNEITETVKELTKTKKKYFELQQVASSAREKYQEIEGRRKKNQSGIFKSKAGLEKESQKLEQKCDEFNRSSTIARNEYILALATANAHQKKYYQLDIPECLKVLDGDVYTKFQDYLSAMSRYELEASGTAQEAYATSLQKSTMISREFSTRCFLNENPVFEWGPKYDFEACEDDTSDGQLVAEQGTDGDDNSLNREARKWAGKFVKEKKQLQRLERLKQKLEGLKNRYTENPEIANEASINDATLKLEKCLEDTRRLETYRLKSESKLDALRKAPGIDVDSWIQSAQNQLAKEQSTSMPSTPMDPNKRFPSTSVNGDPVNGESFVAEDGSFYDDDFDDTFDDTFDDDLGHEDDVSLTPSDNSRVYPVSCTVIYGYKGTRPDELTIYPGDVVEVVEDGDLEQWVKARNSSNEVGYVPEKYLEFPPASLVNALNNNVPAAHDKRHGQGRNAVRGSPTNFTDTGTVSSISGNSTASGASSMTTRSSGSSHSANACFAKAIYEYQGCTDEELSFPEGAIIRIITKDDNGVDDGWWKGELNGTTGVFPALVVEEITSDSKPAPVISAGHTTPSDRGDTDSPLLDTPPAFRPPNPNTLSVPQNSERNRTSSSLPTTPTKLLRPTRTAPLPPQRPRSVSRHT